MNPAPHLLALLLLSALHCHGAEGDFYQAFLRLADTNSPGPVAIKSPFLVDTNNTAPKLKDLTINLRSSLTNGELGAVRLGMTMEQVVAAWGKPRYFWSRCGGGPRFIYKDVTVTFEPGPNRAANIHCFSLTPAFQGSLAGATNINHFLRVLGPPTARYDRDERSHLAYDSAPNRLYLYFDEGLVTALRVIRLSALPPGAK